MPCVVYFSFLLIYFCYFNFIIMYKLFKKVVGMAAFLCAACISSAYAGPTNETSKVEVVQQDNACTGVVKDASGETIIGASVVVKGTTNGTITDIDGKFSLSNVKPGGGDFGLLHRL